MCCTEPVQLERQGIQGVARASSSRSDHLSGSPVNEVCSKLIYVTVHQIRLIIGKDRSARKAIPISFADRECCALSLTIAF